MYTFQSRVRYSELDEEGKLSIASIVDYFQDCSTFQSEDLGVGLDYLKEQDLVWMVSAWQIQIGRYPRLGEKITVGTFPYEFKSFMGYRNFFLDGESGERLVRANSVWTLMNLEKGRPGRPTPRMLEAYRLAPKLEMAYEPRKIVLRGEEEPCPAFSVGRQHLDSNHHVNNGQYIQLAQGYLPEGFKAVGMRAEYKKQAFLDCRMFPVRYRDQERISVALRDEEGRDYAVVEFRGPAQNPPEGRTDENAV